MNLKKYRPLFEILLVSVVAYVMHKLFFHFNGSNPDFQNFHSPIETIYLFFLTCSLIILFILLKVKDNNVEQIGYVFLFLTCFKMGISYILLEPILHSGNQNIKIEKINFFIIFAVFLATETVVTIRILNNKQ